MPTKLTLLLLCLLPTLAFGDVYRIYQIQAPAGSVKDGQLTPDACFALVKDGQAEIQTYAEVTTTAGQGSYSNTSELEYVESLDAQGQVKAKGKKKVGLEFSVKEEKGTTVSFTFSDSRVVRWMPFEGNTRLLQPVIDVRKSQSRVPLAPGASVITGTFTSATGTVIYIIERKAEAAKAAAAQ